MKKFLAGGTAVLLLLLTVWMGPAAFASGDPAREAELTESFREAAQVHDVPLPLLMAIGYTETRWQSHDGKPSQMNGYGVMHLVDNPDRDTLGLASRLTGIERNTLKQDPGANIRGAAAVLDHLAERRFGGSRPDSLGAWYPVAAEYAGYRSDLVTRLYADEVYRTIREGASLRVEGERISIAPHDVKPLRGVLEKVEIPRAQGTPDYPGARWIPADSSNYTAANREGDGQSIDYVIIHTTQGSYSSAINWFQNPSSDVSAHYVIRSSDGEITQMVQNKDIAWHAGNWDYNVHSIGIEHEGYVDNPGWYTDTMYRASAALTRWLCDTYGIPRDRSRIIGHQEVPGADHTDPGPYWDWNRYLQLVNQ